jgi:hypothetical protein
MDDKPQSARDDIVSETLTFMGMQLITCDWVPPGEVWIPYRDENGRLKVSVISGLADQDKTEVKP